MAYKDTKDASKLLMKLQGASTHEELVSLGAEFSTPFEDWLVYKHPALDDSRIFFKKQYIEGGLALIYDFVK